MMPHTDLELHSRLRSILLQLQAECGIYERMVHKNKNQHRSSSYFQYLLKVRRDLRLLQSANLGSLVDSCMHVLTGDGPKKLNLLESLKRRKFEAAKLNFMERLLGAARLLSQMVEPILRAAVEISTLLARSFFMGFSVTILALLARLRVLIQQILIDAVSLFNAVSSISQKKQSVRIAQEGVEVYREFYPKVGGYVTLECVWQIDKFVLVEKVSRGEIEKEADVAAAEIAVRYQKIESFLGDEDELGSENADASFAIDQITTQEATEFSAQGPDESSTAIKTDEAQVERSPSSRLKSAARKVAFFSVKRPNPSTADQGNLPVKKRDENGDGDKAASFYSLLTGGNFKDSIF